MAAGAGAAAAAAPEPVEGPAGWRGSDLAYDGRGWVTELSPTDLAELDRALEATAGRDLASLTAADFDPYFQGLGPKLREIKRALVGGRGIALLRGLPVERISLEDAARARTIVAEALAALLEVALRRERRGASAFRHAQLQLGDDDNL